MVGLAAFTTVYTWRWNATNSAAVKSFSGSWKAVAYTPVRGTLRAQASICWSYQPAVAPRTSPCGGFHDTNDCSPAAASPAAPDLAKLVGNQRSKLRRMVSGPIRLSASRNNDNPGPSGWPGRFTVAPTVRHRTTGSVAPEFLFVPECHASPSMDPSATRAAAATATTARRCRLDFSSASCGRAWGGPALRGARSRLGTVMLRLPAAISTGLRRQTDCPIDGQITRGTVRRGERERRTRPPRGDAVAEGGAEKAVDLGSGRRDAVEPGRGTGRTWTYSSCW